MRSVLAIGIVCFFVGVVSCTTTSKTRSKAHAASQMGYDDSLMATYYYTEGIKSTLIYGDTQSAMRFFQSAIEHDSTHAPSYYESANIAIYSDARAAMRYSQRANQLDSSNIWYETQLARLLVINQEYTKALDVYERLTDKAPHNPDNYRMLAALYEQNNQPFTAINVLDSAEYKLGKIEELADYKRRLLIGVKLYDKAIAETKEMIDNFPYNEDNYLILAELYAMTGKDSLVMANFDQALRINPTSVDVLATMNEYYKRKGDNLNFLATAKQLFLSDELDVNAKIRFFKELTANVDFYRNNYFQLNDLVSTLAVKYPSDNNILELYASHLIASGGVEEALKLYKAHVNDAQPDIEIFNNIIEIESYLQHPDSVEKYTELALTRFPDNPDLYIRHGSMQSYMKLDKEAKESYRKALKYAESDSLQAVIYGLMGDIEHKLENPKKSYSYYDKSLSLYPDNAMVLNNYAYFLSEEGKRLEDALRMSVRSNELTPSNPTYLDTHAWVLYKLGRYAQAKKIMQQAISLDRSDSSELAMHYGDILYALKEYFLATVYWHKAQERGYDAEVVAGRLKLVEGK